MGHKILSGNELIIQGGLESGFSLYTGYPGSPLADYFNILYQRADELKEKGIHVVIGNSEANAAAMASGAKQAGRDTLVAMKSMGLHVASDALSVGNFANPGPVKQDPETGEDVHPGVVIVVGDDPWSMSTSTPADSRYLYKHLHMPFLEPSNPQEVKDWIGKALKISQKSSVYQGLLLNTFLAEGGGRVELSEERLVDDEKVHLDTSSFNLSKNVMVPPNSLLADGSMIRERFPSVLKAYRELGLDQWLGNKESRIGFISAGQIYETLKQVLEESSHLNEVSLYKLASSYPLVPDVLLPFLKSLDTLVIVEEKRGFLENEIKDLCQSEGLNLKIFGKSFSFSEGEKKEGLPAFGGLSYEILRDKIAEIFSHLQISPFNHDHFDFYKWKKNPLRRLPTFCPGCPHRETLSLLKDLRRTLKDKDIDLVSHGDVGCYSLSFLEPFKEMHNLSAMGQGGALGSGVDMFTSNPSVVLMGDSTFFHSGITDISNSVQMGHRITYILLDNDNTAMTGHQMTPVSGVSVDGGYRPKQNIQKIVEGLGVKVVTEVNPSDRFFYKNLLHEMVMDEGVKVIISNKECGLTFHGRQKREERKTFGAGEVISEKIFYQINSTVCEDCRECVEMTGCPGLTQVFDAYGSKVAIDPQICVSDSYCTKIKACPSFEKVLVQEYHPTSYKEIGFSLEDEGDLPLPDVKKDLDSLAKGDHWRVVVTGVGGSGVTTISRVLAEAGADMGGRVDLDYKFTDQKGLAQRNGRVTGHLTIFPKGKSASSITPFGTADLVLSPDLLDGSQAISFLGPQGSLLLNDSFQIPLDFLLNRDHSTEPITSESIIKGLKESLNEDQMILASLSDFSKELLGKNVYSTIMILGLAFQAGRIPFHLKNMKDAIERTVPKAEFQNNWTAFQLGRMIFLFGNEEMRNRYLPKKEKDLGQAWTESIHKSYSGGKAPQKIVSKYENAISELENLFPHISKDHLAQYLHDLIIFDRGRKLKEILNKCQQLKETYPKEVDQKVALRILIKTYWIKDEVFVSHLMLNPLQEAKDEEFYGQLGKKFKKLFINRPAFSLLGMKLEFDISPKKWMLRKMRDKRYLRWFLVGWHRKEKKISKRIREEILNPKEELKQNGKLHQRLLELDSIKGYREILYKKASLVLGEKF